LQKFLWESNKVVGLTKLEALDKFITSYLEVVALPNPGSKSESDEFLLPHAFKLRQLYDSYCKHLKVCLDSNEIIMIDKANKPVSWGKFHQRWRNKFSSYVKVWGKRDGCCEFCSIRAQEIKNFKEPGKIEESKKQLENHLNLAKDARKSYNTHRITTAKEDGKVVLSIDFAENVFVPQLTETPSTFYFKTRRKIDIFGICNEEVTEEGSKQLNYVIEEPHMISKDSNAVISMLDHYIMNYVQPGTSLIIYADNCCGQNKNQYMIGYLTYLTKVLKRHPEIELYFMIVGHTKFSPDAHFGTLKRELHKSVCFSVLDLVFDDGIIERSAKNNSHITYKHPVTLNQNFEWKDWKSFLSSKFKPCVGIKEWHVIKIRSDGHHIMVSKALNQPLTDFQIMQGDLMIDENDGPNILKSVGFSEAREKELRYFEQFVDEMHKPYIAEKY